MSNTPFKKYIKPISIGNVTLENNVFLAPLAGVSDTGFRSVCRDFGAGFSYTEMVSAKGLLYKNKNTAALLATADNETPAAVQLFGGDPDALAAACESEELAKFAVIDLNMGCPVPKVTGHGEGSALMTDIKRAESVIKACVKSARRPVTVKFRKGWDEQSQNGVEFAAMCEGAGAELITVHGRLRSQFYSGTSDRTVIADCKNRVKIPVMASGDVFTAQDAADICAETGADGVFAARGALGNPFIFSELLGTEPPYGRAEAILKHACMLSAEIGERGAMLNMRKHLLWYLKFVAGGKAKKPQAALVEHMTQLEAFVAEVFGG